MNFSSSKSQEPIVYPTEVVLASQSIGRKMLLEKLSVRFRTIPTHVDESTITDKDPIKKLQRRANAKAEHVIKNPRVFMLSEVAETLVIAADSEAILGTKTFGKPADRTEAKEMLTALMGKTHTFVTAVTMILYDKTKETKRWTKIETTKVTLNKLTKPELDLYVIRYDLSRFAAGYALNETPWNLVSKVDGSYTNVIGLPFEVVLPIFRSLDIIKLPKTIF